MSFIRSSKEFIKIIGINFAIFVILLVSPSIIFRLYIQFKPKFFRLINQTVDKRAYYPTYEDSEFSIQLLNEFDKLPSIYRSFIGWRREKVNFKYTTISGPYNVRKSKGESINNSAWFFGGSTMWGTGTSDNQTIPSHFNILTNFPVYNFGESGWDSRQSLNQLINAIGDNHYPSKVVFYDGANDVYTQCRREFKLLPAHSREIHIQNVLKRPPLQKRFSNFIISPYISIADKLNLKLPNWNQVNYKTHDCDTNQTKALLIAKHLVNNWRTAYILSKSYDFEFYGILQPTLFTTKTNSEYFPSKIVNENSQAEVQYNTVYPLIIKEIARTCESDKNFCASSVNATDWLDGMNNIFIDWAHINSLGNQEIAQRLKFLLKNGD